MWELREKLLKRRSPGFHALKEIIITGGGGERVRRVLKLCSKIAL